MILFVGPSKNPITGQSVAFQTLIDNTRVNEHLVLEYRSPEKLLFKLLSAVLFVIKFAYIISVYRNINTVYITTSRSFLGFCRDAIVVLFSSYRRKKIINHLHGSDFLKFRQANIKLVKFIDYIYNKIDVSLVLSEGMREQYVAYPAMEIKVVPNFSHFVSDGRVTSTSGKIRVLYLSNIIYSKGVLDLVEAFKMLPIDNFDLKVAGAFMGDEFMSRRDIEKTFYSAIDKAPNIEYLGVVKGAEKEKLYDHSDVFCLPTFYPTEAQPISIIEAMSKGCYIISTDRGYIADILNGTGNKMVSIQNPVELKEELERVYKERSILNIVSAENIQAVDKLYSLKKHVSAIDKVLEL